MFDFRSWLRRLRRQKKPAADLQLDIEGIRKLVRQIENTQDVEFDCAETMGSLDEYVDRICAGEPREEIMPLVRHHLERCGACNNACAMLLRMLEDAPGPN